MNNINKGFTHGGARNGAGRPKVEDKKLPISFSSSQKDIEILKKLAESHRMNRSNFLTSLIRDKYIKLQKGRETKMNR